MSIKLGKAWLTTVKIMKLIVSKFKTGRNLTVLIGSDPFLPQPDSPTVEPEVITVDENLNTPPPPSVTPEYSPENLTKPLHLYLEADICLDTESKQILQTLSPRLDKDPPLTNLGPIDPDIYALLLLGKEKEKPLHLRL